MDSFTRQMAIIFFHLADLDSGLKYEDVREGMEVEFEIARRPALGKNGNAQNIRHHTRQSLDGKGEGVTPIGKLDLRPPGCLFAAAGLCPEQEERDLVSGHAEHLATA